MNNANASNAYIGKDGTVPQERKPDAGPARTAAAAETAQEPQHQVTPRDVPLQPVGEPDAVDKTDKPATAAPLQAAKGDDELMSKPAIKS